jgi:hypothetical protein
VVAHDTHAGGLGEPFELTRSGAWLIPTLFSLGTPRHFQVPAKRIRVLRWSRRSYFQMSYVKYAIFATARELPVLLICEFDNGWVRVRKKII